MALDERASVCTFDCPDTCSLTVTVADERIVKVRGSSAAPYTAGVICSKVAQGMEAFVHGPQRLLYPLRRSGPKGTGRFVEVSWEEALGEIAEPSVRVVETLGRLERGGPATSSDLARADLHLKVSEYLLIWAASIVGVPLIRPDPSYPHDTRLPSLRIAALWNCPAATAR